MARRGPGSGCLAIVLDGRLATALARSARWYGVGLIAFGFSRKGLEDNVTARVASAARSRPSAGRRSSPSCAAPSSPMAAGLPISCRHPFRRVGVHPRVCVLARFHPRPRRRAPGTRARPDDAPRCQARHGARRCRASWSRRLRRDPLRQGPGLVSSPSDSRASCSCSASPGAEKRTDGRSSISIRNRSGAFSPASRWAISACVCGRRSPPRCRSSSRPFSAALRSRCSRAIGGGSPAGSRALDRAPSM